MNTKQKHQSQSSKIFNCHSTVQLEGFKNPSSQYKWSFILPNQAQLPFLDAIITPSDFPLRYDELIKLPSLKVISSYGTSYDYIDVKAASELGILVTNTQNSPVRAVAELGISLILASVRNIVRHDHLIRNKNCSGFANEVFKYPIISHNFSEQIVGIIGYGKVGKTIFDLIKKLGFKAYYYQPSGPVGGNSNYRDLPQLLASSDVIVLCTSLNSKSYHLINSISLRHIKQGSKIVNISHGLCIDELSLIRALKTNRISGAALDVFEYEPRISKELIEMDQVILSPNAGDRTIEAKRAMTAEAVENIIQALNKTPQNAINLDFWQRRDF